MVNPKKKYKHFRNKKIKNAFLRFQKIKNICYHPDTSFKSLEELLVAHLETHEITFSK